MAEIPTAEAWLKHFEENAYPGTSISECMIEFAKLHVEAALKAGSEKALIDRKPTGEGHDSDEETSIYFYGDLGYEDYIPVEYTTNKDSILNAYLLTNIK